MSDVVSLAKQPGRNCSYLSIIEVRAPVDTAQHAFAVALRLEGHVGFGLEAACAIVHISEILRPDDAPIVYVLQSNRKL